MGVFYINVMDFTSATTRFIVLIKLTFGTRALETSQLSVFK